MEKDAIFQKLTAQFSAPMPDFYTRRIVFWHDEEGAFADMVDELEIPGVKLLKLTGDNNFYAKMLLSAEDTQSNYLVYDPIAYEDIRDNWLLDIQCYSEEFRADRTSMQMEQYGVSQTVALRKEMKHYAKFFAGSARAGKLRSLGDTYATPWALRVDILSVLTGAKQNTPAGILRTVLENGLEDNPCLMQIEKFGDPAHFWEMTEKFTGFQPQEENNLTALAAHILLTALSATMPETFFRGLENYIAGGYQTNCGAMINDWLHSDGAASLYDLAMEVEEQFDLPSRFEKQDMDALLTNELFPCIDGCILSRYLEAVPENRIKPEEILSLVEKRRATKWYSRRENYYECLLQIASMQQFFQSHPQGFPVGRYEELWRNYQKDYYAMDTAYRRFHLAFAASLRKTDIYLEDLLKNAADYVENLYKNWYLKQLSGQWLRLTEEGLSQNGYLEALPQQRNFFSRHVAPKLSSGGRVFVIISDSLRYEVGRELADTLTRETKGQTKLEAMQSVLPSVTKFGMAALLPHTRMELTGEGHVFCDGISTDGTENRQKILNRREKNSIALTYKTLLAMKKTEKRELIAGKNLVYIYHNAIDTVGEVRATEDQVFSACENAVEELKNLVRIITNELSGTNVLITSDHGFLYTHQPLEIYEKVDITSLSDGMLERDRRYLLTESGSDDHLLTVPMTVFHSNASALIPRETLRFKSGGGMNYVHGGATLQEMMVPMIFFKNLRTSSKQYEENRKATVSLISSGRKISNNMFSLDFYQKEPVGGKVAVGTYEACFVDASGKSISDIKLILADKTSQQPENRVTHVRFTLKGQAYQKTEEYFLTIGEKGKKDFIERIPFAIDIAFTNDFDF